MDVLSRLFTEQLWEEIPQNDFNIWYILINNRAESDYSVFV
jgi:hypothetical protein